MRLLPLILLLGVLPGFGEDRQSITVPIIPVALYSKFDVPPSPAVSEFVQDEVESIMAPIGLHFEWRSLAAVQGNEVSSELAVITFKGYCGTDGLIAKSVNPGALGWTHISDGVILPFTDIDCDRVRGFVQKELLYLRAEDREEAYARAIGRVLAHELYHIFANTMRHGSDGVGKSAYSIQELLAQDFQFEARETRALKASRAANALE